MGQISQVEVKVRGVRYEAVFGSSFALHCDAFSVGLYVVGATSTVGFLVSRRPLLSTRDRFVVMVLFCTGLVGHGTRRVVPGGELGHRSYTYLR